MQLEYFAPNERFSLEEIHRRMVWENFHEDLLNKGESLGRVIDTLQYLLDTVNRQEIPSEEHNEFFSRGKEITNLAISSKASDYIIGRIFAEQINEEERDNYSRNLAANLLRGFKLIKEDGPIFLLPRQDKKDLTDFISCFAFPPVKSYI